MKLVQKKLSGLNSSTLESIEIRAHELGLSTNKLIIDILENYAIRVKKVNASEELHSQIDDLIIANNNLITTQNQNTIVIGESLKAFAEQLEENNTKLQALLNKS